MRFFACLPGVFVLVGVLAPRASAQTPDIAGFRTFATWSDDAQVLAPGTAVLSVSVSTWRWAFGSGAGVPAVYGSVGVAPRVQISATFERDRSSYDDGTRVASIGDRYIVGKIGLLDPDKARVGVAVSPMLQVLGNESLDYYRYYKGAETSRLQVAVPVHVQVPLGAARFSASAGVFSLGSTFASAAIEASVNDRLIVNGSISQAYSTGTRVGDPVSDVSRHRTDVTGGAWIILSPSAFVFGSIGRTISRTDLNSLTLSASVGLAIFIGHQAPQP